MFGCFPCCEQEDVLTKPEVPEVRIEPEVRIKPELCTKPGIKPVPVYITNFKEDVNDGDIQSAFQAFGAIKSIKIMRFPNGASRKFGFVNFSSPEEAELAVKQMHGKMFHGLPLHAALKEAKPERQEKALPPCEPKTKAMAERQQKPPTDPIAREPKVKVGRLSMLMVKCMT